MKENQNGGYTPKFIINPGHNGEAKTSSLSGVKGNNQGGSNLAQANQHHNDNANLANANARRSSAPSGKRSEDYAKSLSSNANSKQPVNSVAKEKATALKNNVQNAKRMVAKEAVKKVAAGYGIPEPVTDKILSTKAGQKALDTALERGNMAAPLSAIKDGAKLGKQVTDAAKNKLDKFADKHGNIGDESETAKEKDDKRKADDIESGEIKFEFNLQTLKLLVILTPILSFLLFFMVVVVGSLNDEKSSSMIVAGMVSDSDGKDLIEEVQEQASQTGTGGTELALGKGNDKYPEDYYDRLSKLGNNYSTQKECKGEDCLSRAEFLYYLKIADISIRYRNKYGVTLDWFLIAATNLYFDKDTEQTMKDNLSNYDKNKVEDYDILLELDWDNDFKKMSGYKYLDADDSRYDLNILAKNMVTKKTTQTCTDREGNVTKRQEDTDVEDMYLKPGAKNYLKCGAGESYSIHSTYTKDTDKFDEFMLEYIDNKIYKRGTGAGSSATSVDGNSMSEAFVNLALAQLNDPSRVNGQKYWSYMGFSSRVAWCAAYVSWVIDHTEHDGKKLSDIINYKSAGVSGFMNHFYQGGGSLKFIYNDNCSKYSGKNGSGTYTPKQGDLIFFDWQASWGGQMPTNFADHIGIVQKTENGVIYTIEGNSSNAVNERTYPINSCQVIAFGSWY